MTTEKFKLVFCHTRNGRNVCQHPPEIEGVEWLGIPGSWETSINFYSEEEAALVPDSACANLPEYCWIPNEFKNLEIVKISKVTKDKEYLALDYHDKEDGNIIRTEFIRRSTLSSFVASKI